MTPTCKGCKTRTVTCHTTCERYREYLDRNTEAKKKRYQEQEVTSLLCRNAVDRKRKNHNRRKNG